MWLAFIQTHSYSTRKYVGDDSPPNHDPQEYDEHILLNFIMQFQQQPADDLDVVKHIIER